MEKEELKAKVEEILASQEAKDIKLLLAFLILKTTTEKDDEIIDNIDDVIDIISENIKDVADMEPTDDEAKEAGVRLLSKVAELTKTKWDDRAIAIIKLLI